MRKWAVVMLAALTLAGCGKPSGGNDSGHLPQSHHKVISKAHIQGTHKWFLTVDGTDMPIAVNHATYKMYHVGDRYPK